MSKEQTHPKFEWTDELVGEFLMAMFKENVTSMEQFKQSKSSVLEDKQWEIISVLADDGEPIYYPSKDVIDVVLKNNGTRIHSVKRLSDNTVLCCKDYVMVTKGVERYGWKDIIESFVIVGNDMIAEFATCRQPINDLEKLPTPSIKEDEPTISLLEYFIKIKDYQSAYNLLKEKYSHQPLPENKSSTEQPKEVTDNSDVACLSVNNVMNYFRQYYEETKNMNPTHGEIRDYLIKLSKEKLKQL